MRRNFLFFGVSRFLYRRRVLCKKGKQTNHRLLSFYNPLINGAAMAKKMILLSGYPGTGKTCLSSMIRNKIPHMTAISIDEIKEQMWDQYGYDSEEQKKQLNNLSLQRFFSKMEALMSSGADVISDYPFSQKQEPLLQTLSRQYGYAILTIRLIADLDTLFKRQAKRDLDSGRHLGHVLSRYHLGDKIPDRSQADMLLDYEEFMERCTKRGYGEFQMGTLIQLDVSDFASIDYAGLLAQVQNWVNGKAERFS